MNLMTSVEVAEHLQIQESRVQRLARESLLIATSETDSGEPLFAKDDVEKYKELAERLGGL